MKRRDLLVLLGITLAPGPLGTLSAQQTTRLRKIGFLSGRWPPASMESDVHGEFLRGMKDFGYVEGQDFAMEWRFAEGNYQKTSGTRC